jgi:hypothetical protein
LTGDLRAGDLAELKWASEEVTASLSVVHAHAVGLATDAEDWYETKRPAKRLWGRRLRVGAIMLGGVGVILPVVAQISTTNGKPAIAPGWAAIVLAAAATLIGLDHFFGFSSGWMRFMTAQLKIRRLRLDFEYVWNARRVTAGVPPTPEDVAALLDLARNLVLGVHDAIADETGTWIAEFGRSLDRAEQAIDPANRR